MLCKLFVNVDGRKFSIYSLTWNYLILYVKVIFNDLVEWIYPLHIFAIATHA